MISSDAFELIATALIGDEQAGDLPFDCAVTTTAPGSTRAAACATMLGTSPKIRPAASIATGPQSMVVRAELPAR